MGKVILYIAMSMDGYIAGPNEDLSWLDQYNNAGEEKPEKKEVNPYAFEPFFSSIGAIIMGRGTYDLEMRNGWASINKLPKFILTNRPKDPKAQKDDYFTDEDIAEVVKKAKELTDKNIWVEGGANVVQQFIQRDLLDEIILFIAPVLIGGGLKLFGEFDVYKQYKLREVRKYNNSMAQLEFIKKS